MVLSAMARVRPSVHEIIVIGAPHAGRGGRESAQKRLAQHWVSLAVAALPPQWQERYDEEWRTELNELLGRARLHYAAHQLVSAWSLQRALRGRSPALEPGKDAERMTTASATLGRLGAGAVGGVTGNVRPVLLGGIAAVVVVTTVLVAVISLVAVLAHEKVRFPTRHTAPPGGASQADSAGDQAGGQPAGRRHSGGCSPKHAAHNSSRYISEGDRHEQRQ